MSEHFSLAAIERVARLARLELTEAEKILFARQLDGILAYVEQIQAVDTTGVPPTGHAHVADAGLRPDDVQPSLPREAALAAAPEADDERGYFKVPRVLGP